MVTQAAQEDGTSPSKALLQSVLLKLLERVRREHFETWFRSLMLDRVTDTDVEFSVTSPFVRDWLQKNFHGHLQKAAGDVLCGVRRTSIVIRKEDDWDNLPLVSLPPVELPPPVSAPPELRRVETPAIQPKPTPATRLNPHYTFDKFVVGPCNGLAHASTIAVAQNPGSAYNPLFIHGNTGLGKTHLLQALCHTVLRNNPDARVLYLSCEDFTNTFIQAIQTGSLDAFRAYHRSVDVLVVDDVQFLANKDKTQEEFFHTFNALYDAQKQILISSDRPPVEIPTVEERLVSRFKWGLVAQIETPCFETRVAVVRRKAKGRGIDLPDDVAYLIAERVTANIRELEGAVLKVLGMAALTGHSITKELAETALKGVTPARRSHVSVNDVVSLVTSEFAITARDLTGKCRAQTVSMPRQVAMYLARVHTKLSFEDIGRHFGNRDHTTVLYAVGKIRERSQKDRLFKEMVDGLSSRLLA